MINSALPISESGCQPMSLHSVRMSSQYHDASVLITTQPPPMFPPRRPDRDWCPLYPGPDRAPGAALPTAAAPRQARQQRSPARRLDRHQHGGWELGDRGWRSGGLQEAARGQGRGALAATTPAQALLPALLLLTCTNRFWLGSAGLWRSGVCRRRCLSDKLGRAQQAALRLIIQSFINFW